MAKKNNPAISVIIAMYNAENFIAECLASLANQTMQDFEIIVVDDCSIDNSLKIVESFFATFGDRLKVMKLSSNSGCPGIPRNFALDAASGKYVYFLDSDDLLSETALEDFYTVAEKFNADVVHSEKYFAFIAEGSEIDAKISSTQTGEFVTAPTLETFDIGKRVNDFVAKKFLWQVWGKLYSRKFLVDNKIRFSAISTFEDFIFVFMCVVAAKNYVRVPFLSYYYRIRKNSLSHEKMDSIEMSKTMIAVVNALDNFMNGRKFFHENFQYRYAVLDFFIQMRLEVIAKGFFVISDIPPEMVFNFFRAKIFSENPVENISLTAYLFVAANQQAIEIRELKNQIAELKSKRGFA